MFTKRINLMKKIKNIFGLGLDFISHNVFAVSAVAIIVATFGVSLNGVISQRDVALKTIAEFNSQLDYARSLGYAGFDIVTSVGGTQFGTSTIVSYNIACDVLPVSTNLGLKSIAIVCPK